MEGEAESSSGRRIEFWWNTDNRGLGFRKRWINGTGIGKFQKALPGGEQGPEQADQSLSVVMQSGETLWPTFVLPPVILLRTGQQPATI